MRFSLAIIVNINKPRDLGALSWLLMTKNPAFGIFGYASSKNCRDSGICRVIAWFYKIIGAIFPDEKTMKNNEKQFGAHIYEVIYKYDNHWFFVITLDLGIWTLKLGILLVTGHMLIKYYCFKLYVSSTYNYSIHMRLRKINQLVLSVRNVTSISLIWFLILFYHI